MEYAFTSLDEKFSLIAGVRADYHNLYGVMLTPRLHGRLALSKTTVARGSVGRGYRTPNIWVENAALLASSRGITILEKPNQEKSWNYGISLLQDFEYQKRKGHLSADYFHTEFESQVIADIDQDPRAIIISNLDGRSYANSYQVEVACDVIKNLNLKAAGKMYEVKTTYHGQLLQKALVPESRFLTTASYLTKYKKYSFDATAMGYGRSRLPDTDKNPGSLQRSDYSPAYWIFHAQATKNFKKKASVYIGVENMLDFRQENPIVDPENPFGPYFDASMIWGPVDGRRIYFGLRYKLENE
jgi:outer membrane receptor for ferrienterochelin and colicins